MRLVFYLARRLSFYTLVELLFFIHRVHPLYSQNLCVGYLPMLLLMILSGILYTKHALIPTSLFNTEKYGDMTLNAIHASGNAIVRSCVRDVHSLKQPMEVSLR